MNYDEQIAFFRIRFVDEIVFGHIGGELLDDVLKGDAVEAFVSDTASEEIAFEEVVGLRLVAELGFAFAIRFGGYRIDENPSRLAA